MTVCHQSHNKCFSGDPLVIEIKLMGNEWSIDSERLIHTLSVDFIVVVIPPGERKNLKIILVCIVFHRTLAR